MKDMPGYKVPMAIQLKPDLIIDDEKYLKHFYKLSSSRQQGMGIGAIPFSEVFTYGSRYLGLQNDALDDFIEIIVEMDTKYLELYNAKQDAKGAK